MKERPILFSAPMVRAVLDGRKMQTRRLVKGHVDCLDATGWPIDCHAHSLGVPLRSPFGRPGDRLWVRETWASADCMYQGHENDPPSTIAYRADKSAIAFGTKPVPSWDLASWNWDSLKWKPSTRMKRGDSRIDLRVTGVRVERLQDITEEDAKAEGVGAVVDDMVARAGLAPSAHEPLPGGHRFAFESLWDGINGPGSWVSNPWVWVVSFKRAEVKS